MWIIATYIQYCTICVSWNRYTTKKLTIIMERRRKMWMVYKTMGKIGIDLQQANMIRRLPLNNFYHIHIQFKYTQYHYDDIQYPINVWNIRHYKSYKQLAAAELYIWTEYHVNLVLPINWNKNRFSNESLVLHFYV